MSCDLLSELEPLATPEIMNLWDKASIAMGIPEFTLMENAARAALGVLQGRQTTLKNKKIWLLMGSGNNGGDVACLARHLLDAGAKPSVWHTKARGKHVGVSAKHMRIALKAGVPFAPISRITWGDPPDIIVDGLLGTGFSGELRNDLRQFIEMMNNFTQDKFVLGIDIPSGLNSCTGLPQPVAMRCDATVTFAVAKQGLLLPHARQWTGTLHVCSIGIPKSIANRFPCQTLLLDGRALRALPTPKADSFKNTYGHLLVVGGGSGLGGAAHLAARSALRIGAGLVTAVAPRDCLADIKCSHPEIMTFALASDTAWPDALPPSLFPLMEKCASLLVGPGMGTGQDAQAFLKSLLQHPSRPAAVIDADALNIIAGIDEFSNLVREKDILTPHLGEAARLLGCTTAQIGEDRFSALKRLCSKFPATVVLKGAGTIVGHNGKPVLICPYDIPQLAVSGSGDVLAGCIAGLACVHKADISDHFHLAGLGVLIHALTGMTLAHDWPERGNFASEIADTLPVALAKYRKPDLPDRGNVPWPLC